MRGELQWCPKTPANIKPIVLVLGIERHCPCLEEFVIISAWTDVSSLPKKTNFSKHHNFFRKTHHKTCQTETTQSEPHQNMSSYRDVSLRYVC